MTNVSTTSRQKNSLLSRMLPGLLLSTVALVLLIVLIDFNDLRQALLLADYRWLPAVSLAFLGTVAARAKAWRTLLEEHTNFKDNFLVLNQGYLLNNVLPLRLGEVGRALLLGERSGLGFWHVLSTVVVERIFDLAFAAALLLGSLSFVIAADWARAAALVALFLVLLGFALLFVLASRPNIFISLVQHVARPWPQLRRWLIQKLESFLQGLGALRDLRRFLQVTLWMSVAWFFNVAWYYLLLQAFFPSADWLWATVTVAVSSMGIALPSSPGYIGVLEGAVVASLNLFGVSPSLALAYAIVAHSLYFLITGLLGAVGFTHQGQSLSRVYQRLLTRSTGTQQEN